MWDRALNDLGEKVCTLYPFICELCYKVGHFNFQCSDYDNSLSNPMSTASLHCDDMITPNQHDELTLFLGCEELSRKTSLVDMSAFDMNSVLHGCHIYSVDNCHANTYIQNVVKDETLPKYNMSNPMSTASSTANCGTMVPFLVEMCIFAFLTTFATSVFPVST
jgi:hypothetical protein